MLYVDVDAICKLAHWNVLPHLPAITGFDWSEISTVSSLRFRAERCLQKADAKLFHSTSVASEVIGYLKKISIPGAPDSEILNHISLLPQIDAGEAVLLSLTLQDTHGVFLTGDKRALRGLSQHEICEEFTGKILIIEQILAQCLKKFGHQWVLKNFCPYKHIDKAIGAILGSRCDADADSLMAGIQSYVGEISRLHDPSILFSNEKLLG